MDLSKIKYFLKAAELENFTKAAEACHIGQTTMSKYIQTLEHEVGVPLFVRQRKEVVLTPEGRRFYAGMKGISGEYQELLESIHPRTKGELHIGIALQDYLQLPVLNGFGEAHPEVPIYYAYLQDIREGSCLDNGKFDALIVPDALALSEKYEKIPILDLKQSLVCSKGDLKKYATAAAIIQNLPMITKSANPAYHEKCRENFRQIFGAEPPEVIVCQTLPEQLLQVGMSRGFGILPYSGGTMFQGLHALPLGDDFRESAQLVYDGERVSPSMKTLLSYIHEKK